MPLWLFVATSLLLERATAFQPHYVEEVTFEALQPPAAERGVIDCKVRVRQPLDVSPVRSPQDIHSFIAAKVVGKDIVEVGTRHGDGMMCFAQFARNATAVEYDRSYCKKLEQRSSGNFSVLCADYRHGLPDADIYTWWQQEPDLSDAALLSFLQKQASAGKVREGAEAVLIFDTMWNDDMRSWKSIQPQAVWHEEVPFDERAMCLAALDPWEGRSYPRDGPVANGYTCKRARGSFIVAGVRLHAKKEQQRSRGVEASRSTSSTTSSAWRAAVPPL